MSEICKQCEDPSWTGDEPIVAPPLPHGEGGTSDFNELDNRPRYDGTVMSGGTNIPKVETYGDFVGTDGEEDGEAGLVPAPETTDAGKFLKADGTWADVDAGEDDVEYVDLTITGTTQTGLAVTALKTNDEVIELAEADKKVIFRIDIPSGTGLPASGIYELPLFNYVADQHIVVAMSVVDLVGTLYSINFKYGNNAQDNTGEVDVAVVPTGGGSSVKVLTSADYNYPANNPHLVALWLLDEGQYVIAPHTNYVALRNGSSYNTSNQVSVMVYVKPTEDYRGAYATNNTNQALSYLYFQVDQNGDNGTEYRWITYVIDNLNNSNSDNALSANQGRILKEMIDKTKIWVNLSDIPTLGNTSTDVDIYTSRSMTAGETLTGQLFFNWLNGNSDGNYKLCIKDIDGNNSDEELFLTAVKKAPLNTVSPSPSAIAEMIFTYYDSTGTKTLKVWTEDAGSGKFKISLT